LINLLLLKTSSNIEQQNLMIQAHQLIIILHLMNQYPFGSKLHFLIQYHQ